jgi:capsid protein
MGYDEEDVDRQAAADNARADELGLIFDSDPRRTASNGQRVAEPEPATQVQ